MKERPILFSAPMVRALSQPIDPKDMTRRILHRLLRFGEITEFGISDTPGYDWHFRDREMRWHDISHGRLLEVCPYGRPGDRLWVREAHYLTDNGHGEHAVYAADAVAVRAHLAAIQELPGAFPDGVKTRHRKLRPSIHMHRWASRILLEITYIRVERLQDISEEDAKAEGIEPHYAGWMPYNTMFYESDGITPANYFKDPRHSYLQLWESINGAGSWDANPWVWVISFKRIES